MQARLDEADLADPQIDRQGGLLVADDVAGVVWRVIAARTEG
ncbi:hypothetical protein [Sphingobium bisphenolivorans]|nr:hypothetical protein [Sphingobium bisphenolivorans]